MTPKQARALKVGDQVLTQEDQGGGSLIGFIQKIGEVNDHRYPGHFPVVVKVPMPTGRPFDFETSTKFLEIPGERPGVPEPIARIKSLVSGQITMQTPDGDAFDMFAHQGKDLYEVPLELKPLLSACEELTGQLKQSRLESARQYHDNARLVNLIERMAMALNGLQDLMGESGGVYGYHQNGDCAPWDEFTGGDGHLEHLDDAMQAIKDYLTWQSERSVR